MCLESNHDKSDWQRPLKPVTMMWRCIKMYKHTFASVWLCGRGAVGWEAFKTLRIHWSLSCPGWRCTVTRMKPKICRLWRASSDHACTMMPCCQWPFTRPLGPARLDHPTRRTAMLPHPDSTRMEDDDNFDDDNDDVDVNVSVVSLSLSLCLCVSVSLCLSLPSAVPACDGICTISYQ